MELRGLAPRLQRLGVAAFALTAKRSDTDIKRALRRARWLYELGPDPDLLDRPGRLSVAGIIGELEELVGA